MREGVAIFSSFRFRYGYIGAPLYPLDYIIFLSAISSR